MARQPLAIAGTLLLLAAGPVWAQAADPATDATGQGSVASGPIVDTEVTQPAMPGAVADNSAPVVSDTTSSAPATTTVPEQPTSTVPDAAATEASSAGDTTAQDTTAQDATATETAATTATGNEAATAEATGAVTAAPVEALPPEPATVGDMVGDAYDRSAEFLVNGGPAIWAIAALSVVTVALILWKIWRLVLAGAWSRRTSRKAVEAWEQGEAGVAIAMVQGRKGVRSQLVHAAMRSRMTLAEEPAREETTRVARRILGQQGSALRALELISTIAPLLGLLGTVMGMIAAFQALQEAGSRADPALLAGGIWEALLTTAAGMAVAIPATMALSWLESVSDRLALDFEDLGTRVFLAREMPAQFRAAAE